MNKVQGGTPKGFSSICKTCRYAQVIRGLNFQEVVYCHRNTPAFRVSFPVESCSLYDDKRMPALYQMENIAWEIQSRNRGALGFGNGDRVEITIQPPQRQPGQPGQPAPSIAEVATSDK